MVLRTYIVVPMARKKKSGRDGYRNGSVPVVPVVPFRLFGLGTSSSKLLTLILVAHFKYVRYLINVWHFFALFCSIIWLCVNVNHCNWVFRARLTYFVVLLCPLYFGEFQTRQSGRWYVHFILYIMVPYPIYLST